MAEPSADGIDVDSGAQKMSGAGMANGVRRWPFTVQFRKTVFQRARMARNDFMNAKARKQLTASVHEDALIARASVYQHLQLRRRGGPQRTEANFISLTLYPYK